MIGQPGRNPHQNAGTVRQDRGEGSAVIGLGADDLAATVVAIGADVVAQVHFASGGFHGGGWGAQKIMGAVHATLGGGLLVLLNGHIRSP
jgi:hypothetical protein